MIRQRFALAIAISMLVLAVPATGQAGEPETTTPIKHFVTLMQENHSFDNYFGTYPGADGIPAGTCMPVSGGSGDEECVKPFHIGNRPILDLAHSADIFRAQLDEGRMNGFVDAFQQQGDAGEIAMGYYDDRDLPYYWNIADNYVLFDRFFMSAAGGSVWNHVYWVTGSPGNPKGDIIPEGGFGDLPTIFDRLQEKGISWKFYVQNYDPTITFRAKRKGDRGAQVVWVPLLNYARYIDDPELSSHIVDLSEYYEDLRRGTLPAVSYIVPSGASEHPPGSIQAGQRFVRGLINELMRSSAWETSAFLWTYDDWGGWYDHVEPPKVDRFGYGFRVPTLLVSPYAKKGHVDGTTLDFTSILKFIEENWGVEPLAARDAAANNFLSAFDFEAPAREAVFLPAERNYAHRAEPRRYAIYGSYAVALGLPLFVIALAFRGASLRRRRLIRRPKGASA